MVYNAGLHKIALLTGTHVSEDPIKFTGCTSILFDTCHWTKDTPWDNYVQFWATSINTIPFTTAYHSLFLRKSGKIKMMGMVFNDYMTMTAHSVWKVRFLMLHCMEPPMFESQPTLDCIIVLWTNLTSWMKKRVKRDWRWIFKCGRTFWLVLIYVYGQLKNMNETILVKVTVPCSCHSLSGGIRQYIWLRHIVRRYSRVFQYWWCQTVVSQ